MWLWWSGRGGRGQCESFSGVSHLVHLVGFGVVSRAAVLALELALGLALAFVLALVLAFAEGFSSRAICSKMPT